MNSLNSFSFDDINKEITVSFIENLLAYKSINIQNKIINIADPEIRHTLFNSNKDLNFLNCIIFLKNNKLIGTKSSIIEIAEFAENTKIVFRNVLFQDKTSLTGKIASVIFDECKFEKKILLSRLNAESIEFNNCKFGNSNSLSIKKVTINTFKIKNINTTSTAYTLKIMDSRFDTLSINNVEYQKLHLDNINSKSIFLENKDNSSLHLSFINVKEEFSLAFIKKQSGDTIIENCNFVGKVNIDYNTLCEIKRIKILFTNIDIIPNSNELFTYMKSFKKGIKFRNSTSSIFVEKTNFGLVFKPFIDSLQINRDPYLTSIRKLNNSLNIKIQYIAKVQDAKWIGSKIFNFLIYYIILICFGWLSGFGTSVKRLFISSVIVTILFSISYFFLYYVEYYNNFIDTVINNFDNLYLSFIQSGLFFTTLGITIKQTNDVLPSTFLLIGYIEAVIGIIFMSLMINVFINNLKY